MLSQLAQQGFMRHFLWGMVASVILVTTQVVSVHGQLANGLQSYWPLDGTGDDQIGSVNLSASGNAGFDNANPLAGSAAAQTTETAGNFRAGWVSAMGHGSTFNVTNEYTISSWYRLDTQGSGGEKSSFRQLHFEPVNASTAGLEQSWGWFSPDTATTYNARVVTNAGATTQNNMSFGTSAGVWNHVVQRLDAAGNLTFWHEAATATDHSGADNATAIDGYTEMDTTNMVNGQILTAYYETKGGSGQVSSDEVAIWNRALSNTEIEQLFDNGKSGIALPEPGSLLLLTFGAVLCLLRKRR